jgi:hypothetical protein
MVSRGLSAPEDIPVLEIHLPAGRRFQLEQHLGDRGFAASGLADETKCGTGPHFERHVVDGDHRPFRLEQADAFQGEFLADVFGPYRDRSVHGDGSVHCAASWSAGPTAQQAAL